MQVAAIDAAKADAYHAGAGSQQPLEQTESSAGYPNGHLGHLTESQQNRFAEFKRILAEYNLYKPAEDGQPATHDDALLLRYLRARRWVPDDALNQFSDTESWRKSTDIDTLYRTIAHPAYDAARRLYPQWTGRRDRRGIPLYLFEVKALDSKAVGDYEKQGRETSFSDAKWDGKTPQGLLRLFALYENLTRFAMPFCTQLRDRDHPEVPITMCNNIVDISGVSLRQFWNLKGHMQAASQLATAHFPETLDRIFIIGAPVFFSTVWGWIKRWFDPITVSKIFILSDAEVRPTLEQFIDPRNIPKRYGGELDFGFGDMPVNDPAWDGIVEWKNGHKTFTTGPMIWRTTPDGSTMECVSLGSKDGKKVEEVICAMPVSWPPKETAAETVAVATNTEALVPAPYTDVTADEVAEGVQNLAVDGSSTDNSVLNEKKEAVVANGAPPTATA